MYIVKGYCAGIKIIEERIEEETLSEFMFLTKAQLLSGDLKIQFAGETQEASEVCVDVYEEKERVYRHNLSKAFKR